MREFFLDLLNNLHTLAGLRQLEKIYASHGSDEDAAKEEIKGLLNMLCNVSYQFDFIPEEDQRKIIKQAVISEDFNSLNPNQVYKWLNRNRDRYFKQSHHRDVPKKQAEPVTGEKRNEWLKKWEEALGDGLKPVPKLSPDEIQTEGQYEPKAGSSYQSDPVRIIEHKKKIREFREKTIRERHPEYSDEQVNELISKMPEI